MSGHSGAGMLYNKRFLPQHSAPPIVLATPYQSPYPILFTSITSYGTNGNRDLVFVSGSWCTGPKTPESP